jgi:hypothetical protein
MTVASRTIVAAKIGNMAQATAQQLGLVIGGIPLTYTMALQLPSVSWSDSVTPVARAMLKYEVVLVKTSEGDLGFVSWGSKNIWPSIGSPVIRTPLEFHSLVGLSHMDMLDTELVSKPALGSYWDCYDGYDQRNHLPKYNIQIAIEGVVLNVSGGVFRIAKQGETPVPELKYEAYNSFSYAVDARYLPPEYKTAALKILKAVRTVQALPLVLLDK